MSKKLVVLAAALASLASAALQEPITVDGGQVTGTPAPLWTHGVRPLQTRVTVVDRILERDRR